MKKGFTELVFILDRSGSMYGLEQDTIGGFNSMLEKQRTQEGDVVVTTLLFNNDVEVLHERIPLEAVRPMTHSDYHVYGCTALLDAVGNAIHKTINVQKSMEKQYRAEKVIFVIITDGMENSSREYSYHHIKNLIEKQKKKYSWEFIFLGANIDAVEEAAKMGIGEDRSVTYFNDSEGVQLNYEVIGSTVAKMRAVSKMSAVGREWKEKIEKNHEKREDKVCH